MEDFYSDLMEVAGRLGAVGVERYSSLSQREFDGHFCGIGSPLVLTEVARNWQAFKKWTFEFFASKYGTEVVYASDRLLRPTKAQRMTLDKLVDVCQMSSTVSKTIGATPLYCGLHLLSHYPELAADFEHPDLVTCYYRQCEQLSEWYLSNFGVILIGTKGAYTPLHRDLFFAHGWLAQLCGRKYWVLFPPSDDITVTLREDRVLNANPKEACGKFGDRPRVTVLEPGDLIFVPQGWYHSVISLDPSISVGFNFVNQTNFGAHIMGCARDLPDWVKRLNKLTAAWSPNWH